MSSTSLVHRAVGTALTLREHLRNCLGAGRRARDERGLSQSTEQALLVAGAVTVGLFIAGAVYAFVQSKLAENGITGGR